LAETERQEALKLKLAVQEALKREPALLKVPRLLQERIRAVG
jgi:hypothetical protein